MLKKIRSGKFWLKTLVLGGGGSLLLLILAQALLVQLIQPDTIRTSLQAQLQPTGRSIRFDQDIDRHLFPRPGFTLHQVHISRSTAPQTDIDIDRLKIQFDWRILLGTPKIHKIVIVKPQLDLIRDPQGHWSLADLMKLWFQQTEPSGSLNQLFVEDGQITVFDQKLGLQHQIQHLSGSLKDLDQRQGQLDLSGEWHNAAAVPVRWQATGNSQWRAPVLALPNLLIRAQANLPHIGASRLSLKTEAWLNLKAARYRTNAIQAAFASDWHHLNANITSTGLDWRDDTLRSTTVNAVILAQQAGQQPEQHWNGTLNLNQLSWEDQNWQIGEAKWQGSMRDNNLETTLSLRSQAKGHLSGAYRLEKLQIQTRQNHILGQGQPHLLGDWSGQAEGVGLRHFQTELDGTFDQAPSKLSARYNREADTAGLTLYAKLDQLDLTPYLPVQQKNDLRRLADSLDIHPIAKLKALAQMTIDGQLVINQLKARDWQMNHFSADFMFHRGGMYWNNIEADLYQGRLNGALSVLNTEPPQLTVTQQLQHIDTLAWLGDAMDYRQLSGAGAAQINLRAQGYNRREWQRSLNGELSLTVDNGHLQGLDMRTLGQNGADATGHQTPVLFDAAARTPFRRLTSDIVFTDGIAHTRFLDLQATTLKANGSGKVDLQKNIIDYTINITQTGVFQAAAAHLPLRITGPLDKPAYALDYSQLTQGLAHPQQKQDALKNALKQQWQWLQKAPASAP